MNFRKATEADIPAIAAIYDDIHTGEEKGESSIGWIRSIYPTAETARTALLRDDLFVQEDEGCIVGAAIINQSQVDVYEGAPWRYPALDEQVMVLHTLVISPKAARRGYGSAFVSFYEQYARDHHCPFLRMDTNARNTRARALYKKLGYEEIAIVPCQFNGIDGVQLVLLEKRV
ncbi:MAG: GNAT family N-acetyltransferase [Clostridiales bacterium]|nr:GNAT family N-acetyltransferase [Clostridiales bacterium]